MFERFRADHDEDTAAAETMIAAKAAAANLPDLLVEAKRVAGAVAAGWHGRRRAGTGETFWQFRPFDFGEPARRIDWRRSARDDVLLVREREWEAAHTVLLWVDRTASMRARSRLAAASKEERGVVLLLALADLLGRGGERIGLLDGPPPTARRNAADRIAEALAETADDPRTLPRTPNLRRHCDVVLIGDFLDPIESYAETFHALAASGARTHLVQVLDPVEERFPFGGRNRFVDPESGVAFLVGKAEAWRTGYVDALAAQKEALALAARRLGTALIVHHTDRPAAPALLALSGGLSGHLDKVA
ncbi:DUF58 domain-containing protein [Acuticoccus sp. I52.16.1]|uniref:DUF58 domain-containing protein n=1 Tax=Acuticoccus sp. I52.16.1 TaxID=2928472 RepID=UPI001FD3DBA7|nr:DUF58 domain-containing protein [Acuticoccus sp. I52.16.1]UOM35539.1 DUF58 domain-containing protein [Acuticoccus sp. I52.16.1]